MRKTGVHITPWPHADPPTESALRRLMEQDGVRPYSWSNGPGDVYAAHTHPYHKIIYVLHGSITFGLPEENRKVNLKTGDRLDLPPDVLHDARVGPEGVVCLEGHWR